MAYVNTTGNEIIQKPNVRFKRYSSQFNNLVISHSVPTLYPLVTTSISNDSARVITVTKKSEREYYVKMYNLISKELVFEEKIGGEP